MSAGSWLNHGTDAIGTTPGYMGAWEKLQLGWLDDKTVPFGQDSTVKVRPAGQDVKTNSQAVVVTLPDKSTTTAYNTPHSGKAEWWSGSSDNRTATLARSVDLTGATNSAALTAWVQADIEKDFDYLYAEVSTNAGATWTQIGAPQTGTSAWTQRSYDLSAYKGQNVQFRFRYATDGGLSFKGAFIDDVAVTKDGVAGAVDDVEAGAGAWTASGFAIISGTETKVTPRYYIAENRTYTGYDDTLRTGPYNFGWTSTKPDWVERFPYQNGLLVSYVDYPYNDNNTISHPGAGLVLPVDARPTPIKFPNGTLLGNRRQPFDATFGQEATDAVTFHLNGVPVTVPSSAGIPTFDDTDPNRYWSSGNPKNSVKVAGTGTSMTVTNTRDGGNELQVHVAFAGRAPYSHETRPAPGMLPGAGRASLAGSVDGRFDVRRRRRRCRPQRADGGRLPGARRAARARPRTAGPRRWGRGLRRAVPRRRGAAVPVLLPRLAAPTASRRGPRARRPTNPAPVCVVHPPSRGPHQRPARRRRGPRGDACLIRRGSG